MRRGRMRKDPAEVWWGRRRRRRRRSGGSLLIVAVGLLLEFTNKTKKNPNNFFGGEDLTSQRVLKGHHRKSKNFQDQDR